ncbi:MAG: TolC family protein [Candidatus Eremiobacteraeota bacterium]|nr:TolC family protein [Candidatus Eremiobacteraeota bacterium]
MFVAAALSFANFPLDEALHRAVDNSPDVVAASARVAQSAAALGVARNLISPSLSTAYAQAPQGNPPGPDVIARTLTVGLQTNITDFLNYGPTVRQNVLLMSASRADFATALRTERVRTVGLYYDALRTRAIADARSQALGLATAQLDAAQKRFAAGDAPQLDVLRADVAVARATADLETARVADENALEALRIETAVPASMLQTTLPVSSLPSVQNVVKNGRSGGVTGGVAGGTTVSIPGLANAAPFGNVPSAATAVTTALATRAEISSATATYNAGVAARELAQRTGLPALTVTGGYTTGTDSGVPIGAPSITAALNIPFGAAAHDRVLIEEARLAQARAQIEVARRAVTLEVAASARNVTALRRASAASTRARQGAQAELAATQLGYRNGASSSLEVVIARQTYDQTVVDELGALYDLAKARATLAVEVGQ